MASATREREAASEDPGSFSISPSGDWAANTIAISGRSVIKDATVDYIKVTVRYTINGILNWYTSSEGGVPVQSGSPFNPIGDPEVIASGGIYANLTNSLSPGVYPFWSECSSLPGCRTLSNFTINQAPNAPVAGSNLYTYDNTLKTAEAIAGVGEGVDWYANATGGALIAAPSGTNAGTYQAYAEARNLSTGCTSLTRTLVTLTIQQRPISITVDPGQSKIYGNADPLPFTYSVGGDGLATGDAFDGDLARTAGETVGNYPIDKGTLTIVEGAVNKETNYDVTFTPADFIINKRPITITADPLQTKVYGEADPLPFTYTVTGDGLATGDVFAGALDRVSGENVGPYAITRGTLAIVDGSDVNKEGNYTITYNSNDFTITARPITITVDAGQTKVYGEADPLPFTYQLTSGTLAAGDSFTGALARVSGEAVGLYAINKGSLTIVDGLSTNKEGNYDITFVSRNFEITGRPITITVDPDQTKVYGFADPLPFTYQLTSGTLAAGDVFTGALDRLAGETVGQYAINQGTLAIVDGSSANHTGNYTITFNSDNLTITVRPIIITADAGQTKVYGHLDPLPFSYTVTGDGLAAGDVFAGALVRVIGETVGAYAINRGSLAIEDGSAVNKEANYSITYNSNDFTITLRPITITANPGQTKVYGNVDPLPFTYTVTGDGLATGDVFAGALDRLSGENVGPYAITIGTLAIVDGSAQDKEGNYTITYNPNNFTITARPITITANPLQTKVYGEADPLPFTYTITGDGLATGDVFAGALDRVTGENVGPYAITRGTLAIVDGSDVNKEGNYTITYNSNDFTITARPITITVDAGQTKVYGEADPLPFTYQLTSGTLAAGDSFTGALARVSGEAVGLYAINKGSLTIVDGLSANKEGNYDITFVSRNFEITGRPVTITVDPGQTKVYGFADPLPFTYHLTSGTLAAGDVFTGTLDRLAGETVGQYAINQGTLAIVDGLSADHTGNYTITFNSDNLTITVRPIIITADAGQTKVYGHLDPLPFSYTVTGDGLAAGDVFAGALVRAIGETVGAYAINRGSLAIEDGSAVNKEANYSITYNSNDFTITLRPITITANPGQTKVYGNVDPLPFTYTVTGDGLATGDVFAGALDRVSGENVGPYAITIGTLAIVDGSAQDKEGNYTITYNPNNFTITARPITITANPLQTKVYGEADPLPFTYTVTGDGLAPGDVFAGALDRVSGEDAGAYAINIGSLTIVDGAAISKVANYSINYVSNDFTITTRPITITADLNQTKVYGASDPALMYSITNGSLAAGDSFTGSLARTSGEAVGSYAINQGTLTIVAGIVNHEANYNVTFVPANFTITAMPVTVTVNPGQTKVYGAVNPALYTYTSSPAVGSALANGELVSFTGALTRLPGEDVGSYAIQQGSLANSNYIITFIPDNFTITAMPITVTANPGQSKVYGAADPLAFTYTSVPAGTLPNGEVVSFLGALTRVSGEDVGNYAIQQGTLANPNYTITFVPANFAITAMPVTVTVDPGQGKVYGSADPASFTFTSSPAVGTILTNGETVSFTGALTRAPGENVGSYAIQQGSLGNSNYSITFVPANFTITAMPVTVTADPGQTKVYGAIDPASFTFTSSPAVGSTLANGDLVAFTGALTRVAGENVGSYAIQQGSLANSNYTITFVPANFTITALAVTVTANAGQTKVYGSADPLAFTYTSVPTGALPNGQIISFTGALARVAGENVGSYGILQGTLANANYIISFVPAGFTITPLSVTVTANAGQTKVYGSANPLVYTYTSAPTGLQPNGETISFTGALTRVTGEDVGSYAIQQGTLANANYTITFLPANFTITPLTVIVTANAGQTKVYGTADPLAFTYTTVPTGLLPNGETVSFTGALSRVAGENVGSYAIQPGNLANSNYTITFVSANFTITPMAVTVTAAPGQTKVYGNADPGAFTYTSVPAPGTVLPNGSTVSFTGALTRVAGENIGAYAIQQGTLANSNYTITFISGNFTITPRLVTVTANAQTKIYGNADPVLTYQITSGSLIGTDAFSGALTRVAGENVGTYAILQGTLTLGANYNITYVGASLTITSRTITVTADPQTKIYGVPDPALTYRITSGSLSGTDAFTGALTRDPGQNIGTYAIRQGTLALNANYTLTYIGANLTITTRAITVTANAQTKVYGTADPALTYTITTGSLAGTDAFTGSLTRDPGENVGLYPIRQGTLALNSNYVLTFVGSNLTITIRPVTVTADAKTKVYGDADPVLTYQITSGSLAGNGDAFSGSLIRAAGEDVGVYAITQGTLALGSNYDLTFIGANLTIGARAITVTANDVTKIYGEPDDLTYSITSGTLAGTDAFTGALSHTGGENVGTYPIVQGTLALNGNYTITFVGATLTITPRFVTVTANTLTKVYGDADPVLAYTVTTGSLATGDVFSGALLREAGENVGNYTVHQGDLALNSNYVMTFVEAMFTITPRAVTVTADPQTKIYGDPDPELTYSITSGNLAGNGDAFTGALVRDEGEDVGSYAINQGTLALSDNYTLTFIGAVLTIERSSVAITVTADAKTKVYGDSDPELTYQITTGALVGSDAFTGALVREQGENVGTYAILQGTLALSNNYTLIFQGADFTITPRPVSVTADNKSKVFGEDDPELTYEITSGELAGNGDAFTGALSRAPGEDVGTYTITQGTLTLGSNYDITFVPGELNITAGFEMNAYPNPFSDHIYFEFDLNHDADVLLELFNVVGVKVATVYSGFAAADHYRLEYLPEHMSDGVLIYRLSFNGHVMVLGKAIHKK